MRTDSKIAFHVFVPNLKCFREFTVAPHREGSELIRVHSIEKYPNVIFSAFYKKLSSGEEVVLEIVGSTWEEFGLTDLLYYLEL